MTYDEPLDTGSVPAGSAFDVEVDGTAVTLASTDPVAVSGSTVTLTLEAAMSTSTVSPTVKYTKPASNPIQDVQGNDAISDTADRSVTVTSGPPTVSIAADADSVNEGTAAAFTLSRTGSAAAALTVDVSVTQEGDFIAGAKPTSVTFGAGATRPRRSRSRRRTTTWPRTTGRSR